MRIGSLVVAVKLASILSVRLMRMIFIAESSHGFTLRLAYHAHTRPWGYVIGEEFFPFWPDAPTVTVELTAVKKEV